MKVGLYINTSELRVWWLAPIAIERWAAASSPAAPSATFSTGATNTLLVKLAHRLNR